MLQCLLTIIVHGQTVEFTTVSMSTQYVKECNYKYERILGQTHMTEA